MRLDRWNLYALMLKCRLFEEAVARLWDEGLISGEMHLGTGEEAIIAGVVPQLRAEDALALDHRGTAAMLLRGVDPVLLLREMLGRPDGLCGGRGGHMPLFSKEHLAASSGLVGAEGPAAAGFALAARYLRPGAVAVAFFGDGAMNQGMLLESLNLAAVWQLPVLFVCKDDGWAITTPSHAVTAGEMGERVRGLGVPYVPVDGLDVAAVWRAAEAALVRAREGGGPTFIHARCVHLEGHFLGFPLLRMLRHPLKEMVPITGPLVRALLRRGGAPFGERMAGVRQVVAVLLAAWRDPRQSKVNDPLYRARVPLSAADPERLQALESRVAREVAESVAAAVEEGD